MKFEKFKEAVAKQFNRMEGHRLFRTDVEKELLWLTYLESFPEGSNTLMRERTEYDCQACKSFIRAVGSMVAYIDDELVSLWDCEVEAPYDAVAEELSTLVKSAPIKNILLHDQRDVGVDKNHQQGEDGEIITWKHFHVRLPQNCVNNNRGKAYGDARSTKDVFERALKEISVDAIDTVTDLIHQGSLYRGEEHIHAVEAFLEQKNKWDKIKGRGKSPVGVRREMFVWRQDILPAVTRIRNSVIGTLLVDISEGVDLDKAVRTFESKVAPQNYKRPKAIVTKAMIERARKKVEELGYAPSLGRRFATVEDIRINNVLFANRDARLAMNADVFDELLSETRDSTKNLDKVEEVSIEKFVENILPKATSVDLMVENRHGGNLVNLVAPTDPEAKLLFKWSNNFSWAYQGDLADSIKERVKAQGGSVTGEFRASLGWFNADDLDLHLLEPDGNEIYYGNRRSRGVNLGARGELDVDMNVQASGAHFSRNAVENITYPRRDRMLRGDYSLFVYNYTHRESENVGFEVEVEFDGAIITFSCDREVKPRERVEVAKFELTDKGIKWGKTIPRQSASKELWGISTHKFVPVQMVMFSPNHWDGKPTGNKHYFFMLQGCKREGSSRGFFNEYLNNELMEHKRVFELLGSKMRTESEGDQLSGLGFSSTQRNSVYAKVSGSFNRTIKVTF